MITEFTVTEDHLKLIRAMYSKTHHQTRCPGCDLLKIWVPKSPKSALKETDQP